MRRSALTRRGFTLVEMVVVLAIMGIALALVAPSLILGPRRKTLATVVSDARRTALTRSETITLSVASDGGWRIAGLQSVSTIASGNGISVNTGALEMNISPLGVCTIDHGSDELGRTLDPFACTFPDAGAGSSR